VEQKSAWLLIEQFVCSHKKLKEKYEAYLRKNKNFDGENFSDVLRLFDLFLETRNKKQKQIKTTSPHLKNHAYKISLLYNRIKHGTRFSRIPWWNEILDFIYLGALPLRKHKTLMTDLGVKRVVSMVEPFEHEDSYAGKPLRVSDWDLEGVKFKTFPSPDFRPISLETLYKAALFVKESVELKQTVYIHCKAGRSRSAAVVMAYLTLFKNLSYEDAVLLIRSRRPHIDLENKKNNIETLCELYHLFFLGKKDVSFFEALLLD
jgi:protein-tyrosine phosphatase